MTATSRFDPETGEFLGMTDDIQSPPAPTAIRPDVQVEMSPDIGQFFAAMAAAQAEVENAPMDAKNDAFKRNGKASGYASLAAVLDAARPVFAKHGICIVQVPHSIGTDGMVTLTTILGHKSGQYMRGSLRWKPGQATAHGIGALVTYLRRYCLAAMAGVSQDDDDGNSASGKPPAAPPAKQAAEQGADVKDMAKRLCSEIDAAATLDVLEEVMSTAHDVLVSIRAGSYKTYAYVVQCAEKRRATLSAPAKVAA